MMHLEGDITAERDGKVICRTSELHNQGHSGAFGACKSFAPEGAILTGRGLRPPRPPWIRPCLRPPKEDFKYRPKTASERTLRGSIESTARAKLRPHKPIPIKEERPASA